MFECGTFDGIEDPESNQERKYEEIGSQEPVCPICGGWLNDYGGCDRCDSTDQEDIY